jgi:excisionase family DNA binding protein
MPGNEDSRATLTVDEAAKLLGIARGTAYEAVRIGQLPSIKIGRRILVPKAALERLLQEIDKEMARS